MLKSFILTVLIAMIPVVELRGAIPIGLVHDLTFREAFLAGVIGNLIPVPFIIVFARKVFAWIRMKHKRFNNIVDKLENKAKLKSKIVYKYKVIGLILFVSIPLPGTGAWTGALIAAMLNMRVKYAFLSIALGVIIAGIIISFISYGTALIIF